MMEKLAAVALIALSVWQFWQFRHALKAVRTSGGQSTSPFLGFGLWYGLFFRIILLIMALGMLTGQV